MLMSSNTYRQNTGFRNTEENANLSSFFFDKDLLGALYVTGRLLSAWDTKVRKAEVLDSRVREAVGQVKNNNNCYRLARICI